MPEKEIFLTGIRHSSPIQLNKINLLMSCQVAYTINKTMQGCTTGFLQCLNDVTGFPLSREWRHVFLAGLLLRRECNSGCMCGDGVLDAGGIDAAFGELLCVVAVGDEAVRDAKVQ